MKNKLGRPKGIPQKYIDMEAELKFLRVRVRFLENRIRDLKEKHQSRNRMRYGFSRIRSFRSLDDL